MHAVVKGYVQFNFFFKSFAFFFLTVMLERTGNLKGG